VKIIRLTAAARSEFLKEVSYYEAIQKGLGSRFRKAVTVAFQKSAEFPLHGKPGVADTRRILVDGFRLQSSMSLKTPEFWFMQLRIFLESRGTGLSGWVMTANGTPIELCRLMH
jgi:plasmid stabilization system protein ParE